MRHSLWEICPEFRSRSGLRNLNSGKYAAKWGVQLAGMNFQTRSWAYYISFF
ncbi:MAG: DUF6783 domain-containing protein [Clostridiales bacterium]|nr:DUF6783 domain-containing protein [Clostridiales bacterium]